jgi:hypothetical protein
LNFHSLTTTSSGELSNNTRCLLLVFFSGGYFEGNDYRYTEAQAYPMRRTAWQWRRLHMVVRIEGEAKALKGSIIMMIR